MFIDEKFIGENADTYNKIYELHVGLLSILPVDEIMKIAERSILSYHNPSINKLFDAAMELNFLELKEYKNDIMWLFNDADAYMNKLKAAVSDSYPPLTYHNETVIPKLHYTIKDIENILKKEFEELWTL